MRDQAFRMQLGEERITFIYGFGILMRVIIQKKGEKTTWEDVDVPRAREIWRDALKRGFMPVKLQ